MNTDVPHQNEPWPWEPGQCYPCSSGFIRGYCCTQSGAGFFRAGFSFELGLHRVGLEAFLLEPLDERRGVAVGDEDARRTGGGDGAIQAWPIGVVGEDEALVHGAAAARAADR